MTLFRLALFGLTVAMSSCAVSLCDKDPTDPRCDQSPVSPDTLQVLPIRIPLSGEHITVRLGIGTGTVVLRQNGKEVALGALSDGVLQVHVTDQMLSQAMITLGDAKIVVSRPSKADEAAAIRLFVEPAFDPIISYDTKQDGETPEGLVIKPSAGLWGYTSFPRSGSRAQHFVEYQVMPGIITARGPSFGNNTFAAWNERPARTVRQGSRLVGFSRDLFAMSADAIQLDTCAFSTELCSAVSATPDFTKVLGLASDSKGTMLAVVSDSDVFVYQSSDQSPLDRRLSVSGSTSVGQKAALGDINGDGRIDLVTLSDGNASVFFGQQSGSFALDATASGKLTTALAGSVPTAVSSADIDLDGIDDLVVASGTSLQIIYPLPNGSYTTSAPLSGLDGTDIITIGAVDGKSNSGPDIAISSQKAQRIAVLVNQSTY